MSTQTLAGPDSKRTEDSAPFEVFTVARARETITSAGIDMSSAVVE